MGKTIVEVDSLVKQYGTLNAVDGISFKIDEGDVFAFLGPNGAGKTTPPRFSATTSHTTRMKKKLRSASASYRRNTAL